ncbi:carboxypeptidase inhibitor SmCI [Rhipicephalus sanguineus]|uniref:carboxypeptidase inhibitor SmCI n=1 Tax=Rhipicephalus sanguineus TaxID=34632 RepID=UPI001893D1AB|nr:carboxypeptidase inhibitor SmCI [Rhipicephalus sanguineus]
MQLLAFAVKLWLGGIFVFITLEKIEARTRCFLKMDAGSCRAAWPRWFYNYTAGKCQSFIYGGCKGNQNNFQTKPKCEQYCQGNHIQENLQPSEVCSQRKVVGKCRAAFTRWYFSMVKGACEQFVYGGCGANQNNFHSQTECEAFCQEFLKDRCRQPIIPASEKPCKHEVKEYRFGYNQRTEKCEKFLSSTCKENKNNFVTRKKCLEICAKQSPCLRRTKYHRSRWYESYFYNADDDKCLKTTTFLPKKNLWPRDNRFAKLNECLKECMPNYTAPLKATKKPAIPLVVLE